MNNTSNNNRSSSSSSSTRSSSSSSSSLSLSSYFIGIILSCIISQTLLLSYRNNNNSNSNSNSIGNGINDYSTGNGSNDFNVELLLQRGDYSQQSNSNITADDMAWLGSLATITINSTNTNSDDNPLLKTDGIIINRKATTTTTSKRKLFFIHVGKVRTYIRASWISY